MTTTREGYDGLLALDPEHDVFIKTGSGAPVDGSSGTGVGICGPGSTYIDYTNAVEYLNTGTKALPYWLVKGSQASA
jgi:hypothetical protein